MGGWLLRSPVWKISPADTLFAVGTVLNPGEEVMEEQMVDGATSKGSHHQLNSLNHVHINHDCVLRGHGMSERETRQGKEYSVRDMAAQLCHQHPILSDLNPPSRASLQDSYGAPRSILGLRRGNARPVWTRQDRQFCSLDIGGTGN